MTWQYGAAQRYGTILAGLMIGTAARYNLALAGGQLMTLKAVLIDALQLAFLALGGAIARLITSGCMVTRAPFSQLSRRSHPIGSSSWCARASW